MKIMISGDTHGNMFAIKHKVDYAKYVGDCVRIVILGDFGLWWGHEGIKYLDEVNDYASKNGVQIFAIPGNHENHEYWNALYEHGPKSKGWAYIRSNLLIAPKVLDFMWGGKQFAVAGGAVSIDKDYRLQYERHKGKKIWSPNEQITDAEVDTLVRSRFGNGVPVDYLLTHDCSNRTPFKHRLKPDIDSQIHRQRIDRVLDGIKPRFHFHGHMHEKYDWQNRVGGEDWTQTYGLECDNHFNSWGILDLATDEFKFAEELVPTRA